MSADVEWMKGRERSHLVAKTHRARIQFQIDYMDCHTTLDGTSEIYVIRNNEAAEDLVKGYRAMGFIVEEKHVPR